MNAILLFFRSSIGKKWIVALTGLVLIAYVLGHLAGNLQIFLSPDRINAYGAFLHGLGLLLWVIRAFLLGCFALHIATTIQLAVENRKARPEPYIMKREVEATSASKTMIVSGLIVLCFVIYHILHFTANKIDPSFEHLHDQFGRHDVYAMVIRGFNNPFAAFFYIAGLFLLCTHLSHGFSSFLQTLGLNSRKSTRGVFIGAQVLAWVIFAGYISIPVAVLLGYLKLPAGL